MLRLFVGKGVKPIFITAILSLLCTSYGNANPYPGSRNGINWTNFILPSPNDTPFDDGHGTQSKFESTDDGIDDTSMKGSNQDVSTFLLHII